jgi:hypothetical protein
VLTLPLLDCNCTASHCNVYFEYSLSVDASPLDMAQRLEAIEGVLNWSNITPQELKDIEEEEDNVKSRIIFAREFLKDEVWNRHEIVILYCNCLFRVVVLLMLCSMCTIGVSVESVRVVMLTNNDAVEHVTKQS